MTMARVAMAGPKARALDTDRSVHTPPREILGGGPRLADPRLIMHESVDGLIGERPDVDHESMVTREALHLCCRGLCGVTCITVTTIVLYTIACAVLPTQFQDKHCEQQLVDNGVLLEGDEGDVGQYECNFLYTVSPRAASRGALTCRKVHYCVVSHSGPTCFNTYHYIDDKDINTTFSGTRPLTDLFNRISTWSVGICVTDFVAAEQEVEAAEGDVQEYSVPPAAATALRQKPHRAESKIAPTASSTASFASVVLCFAALVALVSVGVVRSRELLNRARRRKPLLGVDAADVRADEEELKALIAEEEDDDDEACM